MTLKPVRDILLGNPVDANYRPIAAELADWLEQNASGQVAPLAATNTPEQNSTAIEATLAMYGYAVIPKGVWDIGRCVVLNDNQTLELYGALRAKGQMFDNIIRNSQALAFAVGNRHPGSSHPFSTRNVFWPTSGGLEQVWTWSDGVVRGRTHAIWLDTNYTYSAGSGQVAVGDVVTVGGLRWIVTSSDSTRTPVVNKNGVKFRPDINRNISVICHPGAYLDGNGSENFTGSEVLWQRFRRHTVLWHGVDSLKIGGLDIRNSANWSMRSELVTNSTYTNLHFEQPSFEAGANNEIDGIGNLDGANFGPGCHHIDVFGVSGLTNDDCTALLAFYPKNEAGYAQEDIEGRYPTTMGNLNTRYAFADDSEYDIRNINFFGLTVRPRGTHHVTRIVAADGRVVENITYHGGAEQTTLQDIAGNKYSRRDVVAFARVGEKKYGRVPAGPNDLRNISFFGIGYTAREAISFGWSAKGVYVDGVTANYTDNLGVSLGDEGGDVTESSARRQNGIVLHDGNRPFEALWNDGDGVETEFPAPRGVRNGPRNVNTIYNSGNLLTGTFDGRVMTVPLANHDYGYSFRATVTIFDSDGDSIAGLGAFDETVRVAKDANGRPTGDLELVLEDITKYDPDLIPASGKLTLIDLGYDNTMIRNFQADGVAGNGTLKVYVDGVLKTPVTDYTETTGIDPEETQEITFAVAPADGAVIEMRRYEFPPAHQMVVDNMRFSGGQFRGDKPTLAADEARRFLDWGIVIDQRRNSTLSNSTIVGLGISFCQNIYSVSSESKFVDVMFADIDLVESAQMPFRVRTDSDWENSRGVLRDIRVPDRSKLWQYYVDSHGAAPGFLGQFHSSRGLWRYDGHIPTVRAASAGVYGADIFPQWARDGSILDFAAGAFPGLPFAVRARKIGDFPSTRWVATERLDGVPISQGPVPCSEGASEQLRIVSGQNFTDASPPASGFICLVIPPYTNTGSIGVVVDTMTAVAARTPNGAALSAGDVTSGTLTRVWWDGVNWKIKSDRT